MLNQERFKALSLVVGAVVGVASGFLGIYCFWRNHKSRLVLEGLGREGALQPQAQPQPQAPASPANGPSEEQLEIRWHLDSIQSCLDGLKIEVSSLKECIQSIVEKQSGLRKPKSSRKKKRRYEFKRDSDDSTESVSIYFTANAGKASDSESEAGQIEIPAPLDHSMLAFESFTDGRTGLDAESPFLQYQPTAGYASALTDTEAEKDEEEDGNLVQILDFSPSLERESETEALQCLLLSEVDQSEMSALLEEVDRLHGGSKEEQEQGFKVLLDNKNKYGKRREFCWRMIRAYSDMTQLTEDKETQKCYALAGRDEATASLQDHGDKIECQIWLAAVCRHLQDHDVEDRCEENNNLKERQAETDALVKDVNSYESVDSDPGNMSLIDTAEGTEATDNVEEQDTQERHEGNTLIDATNSYDNVYTQHYAMSITDIANLEDRNKEEDMQSLEEANLMVDGCRTTDSKECNVSASDTVQTAESESEYEQQDEADDDRDLQD